MSKIGIVIVNYNDYKNTINLVNILSDYKTLDEIVVVDNKSTDDSVKELKKLKFDKLHVIYSKENKGYSAALNQGAKYLNNKYDDINIIFSNSDIIVLSEKTISKLNEMINDNVSCAMLKVKENKDYKYGWKLTNHFIDLICNIPLINKLYSSKFYNYSKKYFDKELVKIDVIFGCFFMVNGKVLESIDYFDENVFLYYEENILARKLKKINKETMMNTKEYVIHAHNASIGTNISIYNKYKIYKKSQFYYEKNYNKANIIAMFFFKLFYYIRLFPLKIKSLF